MKRGEGDGLRTGGKLGPSGRISPLHPCPGRGPSCLLAPAPSQDQPTSLGFLALFIYLCIFK